MAMDSDKKHELFKGAGTRIFENIDCSGLKRAHEKTGSCNNKLYYLMKPIEDEKEKMRAEL